MGGFRKRQLGKTGLEVSPLGIGCGSSIPGDDLLYAFEHGVNYFFFSSDLHHTFYGPAAPALKQLCGRRSAVRDQVVLATVSYLADPSKLMGVLLDQFHELDLEYVDVFHWGWITEQNDVQALLASATTLKAGGETTRLYRRLEAMQQQAAEINAALLERGLARFVGMSFHSRRAARKVLHDLDVMMVRYNIANTGVEQALFSHLTGDKTIDPGIVAFNLAHEGTTTFHIPPPNYPAGLYVPSFPDFYRFALSNPWVDVVLAGLSNRHEVDVALAAMEQGPLSPEDCAFLREYGAIFAEQAEQVKTEGISLPTREATYATR